MRLGLLKNKKENLFLGLDIGTEAVKASVFLKEKNSKILGYSCCYYQKYGTFDTKEFFKDLLKDAVLKAVKGACQNVALSEIPVALKDRIAKEKKWKVVLTLSPLHLKARTVNVFFERKNQEKALSAREERNIEENIFFQARKKISDDFQRETGILPAEIEWISLKTLRKKVDGYEISRLKGHKGKDLAFEIMAVFCPEYYFRKIKNILGEIDFKVVKTVHLAESLAGKESRLILDVGGEATQGIFLQNGRPVSVFEFPKGGSEFTEKLSEDLGIDETTARTLKERYGAGSLQKDTSAKMRSIFAPQRKVWYDEFKEKADNFHIVPSRIGFMGGGAEIQDIKNVLKESLADEFQRSGLSYSAEIEKIYPSSIKNGLEILTKGINTAQASPLLCICSNPNLKNEQ